MIVSITFFGRFYARYVKVVKTNLTSETLKPSGIKTGRKTKTTLQKKTRFFSKKVGFFFPKTPYPRSSAHEHRVLS